MNRKASIAAAGLITALLATSALAQGSQDDPKALRAAKVAEAWFTANPWTDDYDEARAKARESGKVIFAYFTRSYSP